MKKFPKPWFRPSRRVWYVTLDGKQHNLGPDREAAFEQYKKLLVQPPAASQEVPSSSVVGLIDRFLGWCKEHRAEETFEWYRWRLQLFAETIDRSLTVAQFKPFHIDDFLARYPNWTSGMKHGACRAVQRVMRWAQKKVYIGQSPVADYEKPRPGPFVTNSAGG